MKRITPWLSWLFSFAVTLTLLITSVVIPGASAADPSAAQGPTDPLLILMNGDLWSWAPGDAAPQRHTTGGYVLLPARSPDAQAVAYTARARAAVQAAGHGQPAAGD